MIRILLSLVFLSFPSVTDAASPLAFDKANEHFEKGDYEKAKEELSKIIEDNDDPKAHFNLGNTYYRLGEYKKAEEEFKKAINAEDPGIREWALYNLGNSK